MKQHESYERVPEAVGLAGLSIAEAVILLLIEKGVVSKEEVHDTLQSAVDSHLDARPEHLTQDAHRAAARVIQQLMKGANAVRASAHL